MPRRASTHGEGAHADAVLGEGCDEPEFGLEEASEADLAEAAFLGKLGGRRLRGSQLTARKIHKLRLRVEGGSPPQIGRSLIRRAGCSACKGSTEWTAHRLGPCGSGWIATAILGYDPSGKRIIKRGSGRTRTEARTEAKAKLKKII